MNKVSMVMAGLTLSLLCVGCGSAIRTIQCPDGEVVSILNNPMDAYPVYAHEYESNFKVAMNSIAKILDSTSVEVSMRKKVIKFRTDLDQERSSIQMQLQAVVIDLQTAPCDKENRKRMADLLFKISEKANTIQKTTTDPSVLIKQIGRTDTSESANIHQSGLESVKPAPCKNILVIDKVVMHQTPRGSWFFCFRAATGQSEAKYHIPGKEYEIDGTTLLMDLKLPGYCLGQECNFDCNIDGREETVCTPNAGDISANKFVAFKEGSQLYQPASRWSYTLYWHIENGE